MSSDMVNHSHDDKGDSKSVQGLESEAGTGENSFPSIYDGNQFLFIDASPETPVEVFLSKRQNDYSLSMDVQFGDGKLIKEPVILSKYEYDHFKVRQSDNSLCLSEDGAGDIKQVSSENSLVKKSRFGLFNSSRFDCRVSLNSIITDKKIYKPGEKIRVAVFAPSLSGTSVKLLIKHTITGSEALYEENVQINGFGAGFCLFAGVESGEYEMVLKISQGRYQFFDSVTVNFTVAQYALPLLEAKLDNYKVNDGRLFLKAKVNRLNSPFSGRAFVDIYDNNTGKRISGKKLLIKEGAFAEDFKLSSGLLDPFHVKIITAGGETAEIHFPSKPFGLKNEISLGKLGNHFTGFVYPTDGSRDIGWFNGKLSSEGNFPLILEDLYSEQAVLKAACYLKSAKVVLINPVNETSRMFDFKDVEKGSELSFDVDSPYSIIHAAAWGEVPMESWGIVFKPSEAGLEMEAPDKVQPGQEIKILLRSRKPVKCLLAITDNRIETEDPVKKAGAGIYRKLTGYDELSSGEVKEIDEKNLFEFDLEKYYQRLSSHHFLYLQKLIKCIPENLVHRYKVFPISFTEGKIVLAAVNPEDTAAIDNIKNITKCEVTALKVKEEAITQAIGEAYGFVDLFNVQESADDLYFYEEADLDLSFNEPFEEKPPELPVPARSSFPDVICFEMLDLDGTLEKSVKVGEQQGTFKCCAYAIDGFDFDKAEQEVVSARECYVEINAPTATGEGDEIEVKVLYNTGSSEIKGLLTVNTLTEKIAREVIGEGTISFILTKPGDVKAEIKAGEYTDRIIKTISPLEKGRAIFSKVQFLHEGETIKDKNVEVYPSFSLLIQDCIDSLLEYPYGCAEQTSSKLYGLSVAYNSVQKGRVDGDLKEIEKLINEGLNRLSLFFQYPGVFSLWEGGHPSIPITSKILQNLILFRDLPFGKGKEYLNKCAGYMKSRGHKNNGLLSLGKEFKSEGKALYDLVNLYHYYGNDIMRPQLLKDIKAMMERDEDGIYWKGNYPHYWAGRYEATCSALTVLWKAGEKELCFKVLAQVMEGLREGRLYSTTDTTALIRLLDLMEFDFSSEIEAVGEVIEQSDSVSLKRLEEILDEDFSKAEGSTDETFSSEKNPDSLSSKEPLRIPLTKKLWVSGTVKAVKGEVMVKTSEQKEVNYLNVPTTFPFTLELTSVKPSSGCDAGVYRVRNSIIEEVWPDNESLPANENEVDSMSLQEPAIFRLSVGNTASLRIKPLESTICPICRILLPGNLALLKSGGNVQQSCIPIENTGHGSGKSQESFLGDSYDDDGETVYIINSGFLQEPDGNYTTGHSPPLTVEIAAVRKGRGRVFVVLSDMYDSEKNGVNKGIEVVVE